MSSLIAHASMSVRDRFAAAMRFEPIDRLPIIEWATWWDRTLARWRGEGLPGSVVTHEDLCRHFGLDLYLQDWVQPRRCSCPTPPRHYGGLVASHDDYQRLLPHLYPDDSVDAPRWRQWSQLQRRGQAVLWFTLEGFFWWPRWLLGVEAHLLALYDQPDLIHRINTDLAQWHRRVIDQIAGVTAPDFMTFAEDMSFNHGPMLSPQQFEEFLLPYYRQVVPRLNELGVWALVDSDGDVTTTLPWFDQAGLDGILPLERQAAVDVATLRARHPRQRFIGHFDKRVMSRGQAEVRAEFDRLLPTARGGGFLISCDHQTPPEVSYDQYRHYLQLFGEYAARAGHA